MSEAVINILNHCGIQKLSQPAAIKGMRKFVEIGSNLEHFSSLSKMTRPAGYHGTSEEKWKLVEKVVSILTALILKDGHRENTGRKRRGENEQNNSGVKQEKLKNRVLELLTEIEDL